MNTQTEKSMILKSKVSILIKIKEKLIEMIDEALKDDMVAEATSLYNSMLLIHKVIADYKLAGKVVSREGI